VEDLISILLVVGLFALAAALVVWLDWI